MKITGKYTIKKQNTKIQKYNNLTIFGALQLARLLKRDIVFPKVNNKPYGYTKLYSGQYKKVSIINGSDIEFQNSRSSSFANFDSNYTNPPTISNEYSKMHMIDDEYSTYVKMNFNASHNWGKTFFDVELNQPLNIGKIGLMAKTDAPQENNSDKTSDYYFSKFSDWTVYFRPQGVRLQFYNINGSNAQSIQELRDSAGDYIRVYNINYPLHNNKPYFIQNKIRQYKVTQLVDGVQTEVNRTQRVFYLMYYNSQRAKWAVGKFVDNLQHNSEWTGHNTIDKYLFSNIQLTKNNINYIDNNYLYTIDTNSVLQKNETYISLTDTPVDIIDATVYLNRQKINKWIKPTYRLHNYLTNFYTQGTSAQTKQYRYLQMISDFGNNFTANGTKTNGNFTVKYSKGDANFNNYLAYSCFSFQDISEVNKLYNFIDNGYVYNVDFCNEQLVGFMPYVDGIRFCKTNNGSGYYNTSNNYSINRPAIFYSIDVFVKTPTPYNPIKIGLSENGTFNDANSWFVDNITKVGNNKVVFTKTLETTQGVTNGSGYKYIGLFGNFDGHLDGTLPADVYVKNSNCFSKAEFAIPWSKDNDQSIVITYQLTIGDENIQENNQEYIDDGYSSQESNVSENSEQD